MIDLDYAKRHIKTSMVTLPTYHFRELIEALEEAKKMMEVIKKGSFGSYSAPKDWLEKYFEEPLGNNGEPIKNVNPEICEEQLERLSHETE